MMIKHGLRAVLLLLLLTSAAAATPTCWPAQVLGTGSPANFQTNSSGWAMLWKCPDGTTPFAIGAWSEMDADWLTQLATASAGGNVAALWTRTKDNTIAGVQANYPTVFPLLQGLIVQASTPGAPQSVVVK